jgi:hypothetical protein
MKRQLTALAATILAAASVRMSLAATSATASNTVAPTLNVSVNVQTAVSLTLATGSDAGSCVIASGGGGDFNISLGNVNGLGLGTPTCGAVASVTPANATYATNYQMTPSYSGFTATTATVSLTAPVFTHSGALTLEEGTAAGSMTAVPTSGTAHGVAVTASGTPISRYLGVQVSNANGGAAFPGTAGGSGADSTLVTFTMTVP